MAKKDSKKPSEKREQPPKDVKEASKPEEEASKEPEKETGPKNPYEEGTKRYLIAKELLAGKVDRNKIASELGVSLNTIYNVTGDLTKHGYTLAIQQNKRKVNYSPNSHLTHNTH